ncbi:Hypothetical protein POVN_LOCUS565 [uncultured virus]|nr:Hypothetical protein POVN_LOCUS565 [uncultured virus]
MSTSSFSVPCTARATPYKGIVLLSLDNGIIWDPAGGKKPKAGTWIWAISETERFFAYLHQLSQGDFLPIFWSPVAIPQALTTEVEAAASHLLAGAGSTSRASVVTGATFEQLLAGLSVYNKDTLCFEKELVVYAFVPTLEESPENKARIPTGAQAVTFAQLGFEPEPLLPEEPSLLILMGMPGSGKSTLAARLANNGYLVYDEKEAAKLRKGQIKVTKTFLEQLGRVKAGTLKGVVIDSTNPSTAMRNVYIELAQRVGVPYYIGWITRPGWESNALRTIGKVPPVGMNYYGAHFEAPTEHVIRLV